MFNILKQVCLFLNWSDCGKYLLFPVYQVGLSAKIKGAMRGKFIHAGLARTKQG